MASNLRIVCQCMVDADTRRNNALASPPALEPSGSGVLALVAGGPSVIAHLNTLRAWPGEIWAINHTAAWLRERGIDCWYFSADADDKFCGEGGKCILADHCGPSRFERAGELRKFAVTDDLPGPTSAVSACYVAIKAGFSHVTLFGCEGSYGATTHVDRDEPMKDMIRVQCGGETFLTKLELASQTEQLSQLVRELPNFFAEESGGFLRALVDNPVYDVTHVARNVMEKIRHAEDL